MSPLFSTATIVDWEALLDTAVASLVAALVVTLAASVAIYGAATFADAQREERYGMAVAAALIGLVGGLAFAATIGVGLYVMING